MAEQQKNEALTFVPCVLVTKVLPTWRVVKVLGAFTSYQSFLEKGSTLHHRMRVRQQHCQQGRGCSQLVWKRGLHFLLASLLALTDPFILPDSHLGQQMAPSAVQQPQMCCIQQRRERQAARRVRPEVSGICSKIGNSMLRLL
jgi:hypothetical protein